MNIQVNANWRILTCNKTTSKIKRNVMMCQAILRRTAHKFVTVSDLQTCYCQYVGIYVITTYKMFTLKFEFNYIVFDIFRTSKCSSSGRLAHISNLLGGRMYLMHIAGCSISDGWSVPGSKLMVEHLTLSKLGNKIFVTCCENWSHYISIFLWFYLMFSKYFGIILFDLLDSFV
jgi:hypothetical protein